MPPNITTRLVAETNPAYLQVGYHYDVQGCTNAASAGRARAADGAGRLLNRILSNGAITHYGWDAAGRLTRLKNTTLTGELVNDTQYTRDRLGNILSQTDDVQGCTNVAGAGCAGATTNALGQVTGATTYTYDPEYRLLTADYPGTAFDESFSYDKVGNRKTHTLNGGTKYYNYNAGNRLQNIRGGSPTGTIYESYQYDDNGSLTTVSGNRSMTLSWDANNRVKQINSTQYRYDPKGYRIHKAASLTSRYYLEGEHLEAVYDGNGALRDQYLRGTVIDEVVNGYHRSADNVMVNSTYHHDALQSVLGQSAHDGQIQSTQTYTAFGGNLSGTGTSNAAQKYTGREADGESGFYYYRARYYDPVTGRFISEDPLGFKAGVNFYVYVNNNPINASDPTGLIDTLAAIQSGLGMLSSSAGAVVGVAGISGGGALLAAPDPTLLTKAAGLGTISYSSALLANSSGNFVLNAQNFASALRDQPAGVPGSLAEGVAGIAAPGNINAQLLANAFNLTLDLASGRVPVGRIPTNLDSALSGFKLANFSELNNYNATAKAIGGLPVSVGAVGTAASTFFSDALQFTSTFQTALNVKSMLTSNFTGNANGGFVIYPNKSNTNMMQSVYRK